MIRLQKVMRCGRTEWSQFLQQTALNYIGDISRIYYSLKNYNIKQKQRINVSGLQVTLGRLYEGGLKK